MRTCFIDPRWLAAGALIAALGCGDNSKNNGDGGPIVDAATDGGAPDAVGDGPPVLACTPPANPPVLASLTSGDVELTAADTTVVAPITAPLGTSILFTSLNEIEPSPANGGVMCVLQDNTGGAIPGVMCRRQTAGTDDPAESMGIVNIHWTVATFTSGVAVQRGIANTNVTNPNVVTLSPAVDPTSSFVLLGGEFGGGTGWGNNEFSSGALTDGTTVTVGNNTPGSTIGWQVVTMTGASVQRGTVTFASADTAKTQVITPTPPGSMAIAGYQTDNLSGIAASALMVETHLTNPTTLSFTRATGGAGIVASYEVVALPFATKTGIATFAAGATSSAGAATGIVPATSVGFSSSDGVLGQAGGSTTYAGTDLDLLGEAAATITTGTDAVALTRASSQASAAISWTVIDFAHNCAGAAL